MRLRRLYGIAALGWFGGARQWGVYERGSVLLAAVLAPLVVSVHSVVSFDFAVTQNPGWHETLFPPYFVAGAIFSGMAMVQLILVIIRRICSDGIGEVINPRVLEMTGRFVLGLSLVMGIMYFWEYFMALLNGVLSMDSLVERMTGKDAVFFWLMIGGNLFLPQLYWIKRWRSRGGVIVPVALGVLIGMWCERWMIVVHSLESAWRSVMNAVYTPTVVDWGMGAGSLGLFVALYMVLMRVTPFFSLCEMRFEDRRAQQEGKVER